jgi:hypothetical protein
MPYIVKGEPSSWKDSYIEEEKFSYKYPNNLDLKPGSDFHNKLRDKIWNRANESRHEISKRFPYWREIDRTLTTYIPLKGLRTSCETMKDSYRTCVNSISHTPTQFMESLLNIPNNGLLSRPYLPI